LIVARPRDGAPVVMSAIAALVWQQLDDWTTLSEIDRWLAETFPDTPAEVRLAGRTEILERLEDDDLIERR